MSGDDLGCSRSASNHQLDAMQILAKFYGALIFLQLFVSRQKVSKRINMPLGLQIRASGVKLDELNNLQQINTSNLQSGIYFVQILDKNALLWTDKLMINR